MLKAIVSFRAVSGLMKMPTKHFTILPTGPLTSDNEQLRALKSYASHRYDLCDASHNLSAMALFRILSHNILGHVLALFPIYTHRFLFLASYSASCICL